MTSKLAFWAGFHLFILAVLALDLGVVNRRSRAARPREAAIWTAAWVTLAMLFAAGIWTWSGHQRAIDFVTGYIVEYSLSVDNIFVFVLIFAYFKVPAALQHRVLFWGILGAIVMRGAMIAAGSGLLLRFHWFNYVFGVFLLYTGVKIALQKEKEFEPGKSPLVRIARRLFPITGEFEGSSFFVRRAGRAMATPLFLVLIVVETSDVVFAVDSIHAVFAVTRDPFIVYTSNIFAILGLRSLYFLVKGAMGEFRYLEPSLAAILVFVGLKMCADEFVRIPAAVSLLVILVILLAGIGSSFFVSRRETRRRIREESGADPAARGRGGPAPGLGRGTRRSPR